MAEAGVPGFEVVNWYGVAAPRGTPRALVERLAGDLATVLRLPEVAEQFARDGIEPVGSTPEQFARHLAAEIDKWRRLVSGAAIVIQ